MTTPGVNPSEVNPTELHQGRAADGANVDDHEIEKFNQLAQRWWDVQSEFKPLHEINPLRVNYIERLAGLVDQRILDVGCGGGILAEAMAVRGADVFGIDAGEKAIAVAKLHGLESGVSVQYERTTIENLGKQHQGQYDVVTCMEMLEHVPDPASVVSEIRHLLKPGGRAFFSTINRNVKSYLMAIIGAEYLLQLLPKGTHDYDKFIKPSELARFLRDANLLLEDIIGLTYNPLTKMYRLAPDVDVNYMLCAKAI